MNPEHKAWLARTAEKDARRKQRFDAMSDDALMAEYQEHMEALNRAQPGNAMILYIRGNSARVAWEALHERGCNNRVLAYNAALRK